MTSSSGQAGANRQTAASVGAVVVTYRRPEVLKATLDAVLAQTTPPNKIIVVDNAAAERSSEVPGIVDMYDEDVHYLPTPANLGYGAGLTIGMEYLHTTVDPAYYWLLDDDSPPGPATLAAKVAVMAASDGTVGVVAGQGGHVRFGRIRHDLRVVTRTQEADFTLVDGSVISSAAVVAAGYPRTDLFMMLEDFEYTTRIASAGFRLLVLSDTGTTRFHLGSTMPWRGYYQARNMLRIALDRRSVSLLFGCMVREMGFGVSLLRRKAWTALGFRTKGLAAAMMNRMGRTVDPQTLTEGVER